MRALIVALVLAASPALAQDKPMLWGGGEQLAPKFGGCLTGGGVCFGPSVSISLVAVDLKDGSVTSSVSPGLGYGVTWYSQKNPWLSVGFSAYATFRETADGQRVVASGVFSFVEYLRIGVGQQVGPGARPFLLLGVGADLGAVR